MRDLMLDCKSQYIQDLFSVNDDRLNEVYSTKKVDEQFFIQLTPMEGRLLQLLIKMNNISSVVEVGMFFGYSAACMALALPENGHVCTIEKNQKCVNQATENFLKCNLSNRITVMFGDGLQQLKNLESKKPFDMIFIDADKGNYCNYLDWAEKYVKKGGLIVADNTLLFDAVYMENPPKNISKNSWNVMREFNYRLSDETKYCSTLIPTKEGLTVALKKF